MDTLSDDEKSEVNSSVLSQSPFLDPTKLYSSLPRAHLSLPLSLPLSLSQQQLSPLDLVLSVNESTEADVKNEGTFHRGSGVDLAAVPQLPAIPVCNWNEQYQKLLPTVVNATCIADLTEFNQFVQSFVEFSKQVARVISREVSLCNEAKSIKPLNQDEVQASPTYRYKYDDIEFILIPSHDEKKRRQAANETKAARFVSELNIPYLHTTLSSLVYVNGNLVQAVAAAPLGANSVLKYAVANRAPGLAPIREGPCLEIVQWLSDIALLSSPNTLVAPLSTLGSSIQSIPARNSPIVTDSSAMTSSLLSSQVNTTQPPNTRAPTRPSRNTDSHGDVLRLGDSFEGYLGNDDRYYFVGLSDLLPPRFGATAGATSWKRVRPEFVWKYNKHLRNLVKSKSEPHRPITDELLDFVIMSQAIPQLVRDIEFEFPAMVNSQMHFMYTRLTSLFHENGVNMCQLGQVRDICTSSAVKDFLLRVMVARTAKCLIRNDAATNAVHVSKINSSDVFQMSQIISQFLRRLFLSQEGDFLRHVLRPAIQDKFQVDIRDSLDTIWSTGHERELLELILISLDVIAIFELADHNGLEQSQLSPSVCAAAEESFAVGTRISATQANDRKLLGTYEEVLGALKNHNRTLLCISDVKVKTSVPTFPNLRLLELQNLFSTEQKSASDSRSAIGLDRSQALPLPSELETKELAVLAVLASTESLHSVWLHFCIAMSQLISQKLKGGQDKTFSLIDKLYRLWVDPNFISTHPSMGIEHNSTDFAAAAPTSNTSAEENEAMAARLTHPQELYKAERFRSHWIRHVLDFLKRLHTLQQEISCGTSLFDDISTAAASFVLQKIDDFLLIDRSADILAPQFLKEHVMASLLSYERDFEKHRSLPLLLHEAGTILVRLHEYKEALPLFQRALQQRLPDDQQYFPFVYACNRQIVKILKATQQSEDIHPYLESMLRALHGMRRYGYVNDKRLAEYFEGLGLEFADSVHDFDHALQCFHESQMLHAHYDTPSCPSLRICCNYVGALFCLQHPSHLRVNYHRIRHLGKHTRGSRDAIRLMWRVAMLLAEKGDKETATLESLRALRLTKIVCGENSRHVVDGLLMNLRILSIAQSDAQESNESEHNNNRGRQNNHNQHNRGAVDLPPTRTTYLRQIIDLSHKKRYPDGNIVSQLKELAVIYDRTGRCEESRQLFRRVKNCATAHPGAFPALVNGAAKMCADLGVMLEEVGQVHRAAIVYRQALDLLKHGAFFRAEISTLRFVLERLMIIQRKLDDARSFVYFYHETAHIFKLCYDDQPVPNVASCLNLDALYNEWCLHDPRTALTQYLKAYLLSERRTQSLHRHSLSIAHSTVISQLERGFRRETIQSVSRCLQQLGQEELAGRLLQGDLELAELVGEFVDPEFLAVFIAGSTDPALTRGSGIIPDRTTAAPICAVVAALTTTLPADVKDKIGSENNSHETKDIASNLLLVTDSTEKENEEDDEDTASAMTFSGNVTARKKGEELELVEAGGHFEIVEH